MKEALQKFFLSLDEQTSSDNLCAECRGACCCFELSGHIPFLTQPEWDLITDFLNHDLPAYRSEICPFLEDATGRCSIYPVRSFRCRSYYCDSPAEETAGAGAAASLNTYQILTAGLPQWSLLDFFADLVV